ncbi:MAG: DUF2127 domain-containing protein [Sedimentisphaerales bacterium]|jgi:uncharacterized membrane protein
MKKEKLWHVLFLVGIFFKGLDGVLESLGGLVLLFLNHTSLMKYVNDVTFLFHEELTERPPDAIFQYLLNVAHVSENTQLFAGIYLVGHGAIKMAIVAGLYFKRLWVYPLAEGVLGLFIVYQLYRFTHTYSILLLFLSVVDAAVILLIYKEYKRLKNPAPRSA